MTIRIQTKYNQVLAKYGASSPPRIKEEILIFKNVYEVQTVTHVLSGDTNLLEVLVVVEYSVKHRIYS